MSQENNNYIMFNKNIKPHEVVSIPVSLSKSQEGKYFVGQTEPLCVSDNSIAWAGLVNPHNSDVNLYVNVFTISNFSDEYLTAEIWLNTNLPKKTIKSYKVSPTNTSLKLLPKNKVDILFAESSNIDPENGVNVYERIVQPNTTLVGEEDGKFIEAPCGNYAVIIKSSGSKPSMVIVAFGWWEEPRC